MFCETTTEPRQRATRPIDPRNSTPASTPELPWAADVPKSSGRPDPATERRHLSLATRSGRRRRRSSSASVQSVPRTATPKTSRPVAAAAPQPRPATGEAEVRPYRPAAGLSPGATKATSSPERQLVQAAFAPHQRASGRIRRAAVHPAATPARPDEAPRVRAQVLGSNPAARQPAPSLRRSASGPALGSLRSTTRDLLSFTFFVVIVFGTFGL